ncbi:hypothetical protein GCM10008922_25430 [Faecalicatena contorta]|uniref:Uncharacterized protein n=1 Tax=Faecalicatena contorta TaxID=39482 RepID=A0A174JJB9_9FIRM|nr:hypothetical protein [Faecalicatena contorta]MEE0200772.1 hypothetical protein [Muricomes sp.]CUO99844.1 Uncharacterised protein [[Eubacterium] contortum] [Faecalicatena contorta]DAZ71610.1 MAG TPA: hypothetical protein [Caudoviricetes sp.]
MLMFLVWICRITAVTFLGFLIYLIVCLIKKKGKKIPVVGVTLSLVLFITCAISQSRFHVERIERSLDFLGNAHCYEIQLDNRKKALQIWNSIEVNKSDSISDSWNKAKEVGILIGTLSNENWFDYDYVYYDTWGEEVGRIVTVVTDMSDLSVTTKEWID